MNKYFPVFALAAIILLVAGWWIGLRGTRPPEESAATTTPLLATSSEPKATQSAARPSDPTSKKPQTYTSLITQAGSHRCDYEQVNATGHTSGVVYIAGGSMRVELRTADADGSETRTLTIYDGRSLYTWTEGLATGVKTQPSSVSQLPLVIPANLDGGTVLGSGTNNVSWNCHAWIKDPKILTPPSYVRFISR